MSRPKVLIIDDEVALTRILQLALEAEEEFEVHVLNNPLDVLETMRSVVPDVIVLDIIMPGKNGLEVAEEYVFGMLIVKYRSSFCPLRR